MNVHWGGVCRPKSGQSISGDIYVIEPAGDTKVLAAIIDGLGGGTEAALAAEKAAAVLRARPEAPLQELINQAHRALHQTRGAVIGLLQLEWKERRMSYIGVGNIGVQVYSTLPIKPISKNGILGYRLPSLLQLNYSYNSGDTFVLYSDGISSRFGLDGKLDRSLSPQVLAETVLQQYGKTTDDATVLVLRCS